MSACICDGDRWHCRGANTAPCSCRCHRMEGKPQPAPAQPAPDGERVAANLVPAHCPNCGTEGYEWIRCSRCAPADSEVILGVGDGSGNLFVRGSYEAIKRVQDEALTDADRELLVNIACVLVPLADRRPLDDTASIAISRMPKYWQKLVQAALLAQPAAQQDAQQDTERMDWLEAHSAYWSSAIEMDPDAWLDDTAPTLRAAIDAPRAVLAMEGGQDAG